MGNPGRIGVGGLIRDDLGQLKLAFVESLDHKTNNMVECLALYHGLKHCKELGLQQVKWSRTLF